MSTASPPRFRPYEPRDRDRCLAIFDANCPEAFAPNEREDYDRFLAHAPAEYEVCLVEDAIVGAFGLVEHGGTSHVNWILIDPDAQGRGVGATMMRRALQHARDRGVREVHIAASHKSAPFFVRFGAVAVRETRDGWGPGMHRVDMILRS